MMKAIVIDASAQAHLRLGDVPEPQPLPGQALVSVKAISLNRGEVRGAQGALESYVPGWDLAGVVEQAATDGSGPKVGARLVGFVPRGAWAERVAVPTNALAELPAAVTFAQASTLPVAGLTALYCLEMGGGLIGKRVLILVTRTVARYVYGNPRPFTQSNNESATALRQRNRK
jgi:NADPH:quinone reductase-like Zn-dependent oxidoreductase